MKFIADLVNRLDARRQFKLSSEKLQFSAMAVFQQFESKTHCIAIYDKVTYISILLGASCLAL